MMIQDRALSGTKTHGKPTVKTATPAKAPTDGPGEVQVAPVDPEKDKCANQSLFLRRDRTDVFAFLQPCGPDDVPGASASYTRDLIAHTQNLNIQALAGYTALRGSNSDGTFLYSFSPSAYFNGVLAEPFRATERNVIRTAFDSQFLASTPDFIFRTHTFDLAPYYQTDFRGRARIEGVDAVWEPYNVDILLGGRYDVSARRPVGLYWRLQGEADVNRVDTAGQTNFRSATNHAFLGGTLQTNMIFFQNMPEVGEAFCGRIYASGRAQRFTDVQAGRSAANYTAEIGYYLGAGVAPFWRYCVPKVNGEAPVPSASATSSSISLVYSDGTDKTTMVNQHQYKVQLNFRY
jgi:hypothetical protein